MKIGPGNSIIVDLDGTLTTGEAGPDYADARLRGDVAEKLRAYKAMGFGIGVYTARNMRTHANSVGRINALTLPVIVDWLRAHNVPFDEIHVGKPWPGPLGFYVDDRAIRPDEFLARSLTEIRTLTSKDG